MAHALISRLEGAYEHLATKADIAHIEAQILRWLLPMVIASTGATAAIVRLVAGG